MWWNGLKMRAPMALVIVAALAFATAPASADKPSSAGGKEEHRKPSKKNKQEAKGKKAKKKHATSKGNKHGTHFGNHDRDAVRDYYGREFRKGKGCPPGLAKKHNGCIPPGQAKKRWTYGHPLPRDVAYHDLPRQLVLELLVPPDGYRYVRVVSDILLIAIGTGIVIDAIEDLGNL